VVTPGSYFGPSGEGYVRIALTPPLEECKRAAAILEAL
jgi:aspartate/methionine/tyrosine aminotransferase